MPSAFVPRASASHRVACIRLYRALLRQTASLQSQTENGCNGALSNFLRYRFRRDRDLHSPTQIANGLKAGYVVLDLVHACNQKDGNALKKLATIVERTTLQAEAVAAWRSMLAQLNGSPTVTTLRKVAHIKAVSNKANQVRHPPSKPILERPLPLSEVKGGNRRVPNLVTAQGIPFLRYSKPQPVSLSRVLRQRIKWYEKNWTAKEVLEENIARAELEDQWDQILKEEHGIVDCNDEAHGGVWRVFGASPEPSWADEFRNADKAVLEAIRAKGAENAEMGRKMWEVVKKEKALKRQEKIERRAARKAMQALKQTSGTSSSAEAERIDIVSLQTPLVELG